MAEANTGATSAAYLLAFFSGTLRYVYRLGAHFNMAFVGGRGHRYDYFADGMDKTNAA